jgi:threonine synthase
VSLGSSSGTAVSSWADGWNPHSFLRCISCGAASEAKQAFLGCPSCEQDGWGGPLEVVYTTAPIRGERSAVLDWMATEWQPISFERRVGLGRPMATPLVPLSALGRRLFAKNETVNPTWGHKDRLHEVAVGVAKLMDCRGVVAASTGNHGASAAAHASAAGLPSVVFCHPKASANTLQMITAYGGQPVFVALDDVQAAVAELVDAGWCPATSMDPLVSGRSNPYGAEGYKTLAYEVVNQLGRAPGTVIVPTASGDTFYGIAKGFAEASSALGEASVSVVAAQPCGADPLVRSAEAGHLVRVNDPRSMALSVAEALTGRQALEALARWGGSAVGVEEEDIAIAVRDLAHRGLLVEPASAVALAAFRSLEGSGRLSTDRDTVLVLTGAGIKWPQAIAQLFPGQPVSGLQALNEVLVATRAKAPAPTGGDVER